MLSNHLLSITALTLTLILVQQLPILFPLQHAKDGQNGSNLCKALLDVILGVALIFILGTIEAGGDNCAQREFVTTDLLSVSIFTLLFGRFKIVLEIATMLMSLLLPLFIEVVSALSIEAWRFANVESDSCFS